jgi:hypothetical protein
MTNGFDDRKKAEEERFAHDEELRFKAEARRNYKLGLWVAELIGLTGAAAEDYAKTVIMADLEEPGDDDVVRKVMADLKAKGVDVSEHRVRNRMAQLMEEAKQEILREG